MNGLQHFTAEQEMPSASMMVAAIDLERAPVDPELEKVYEIWRSVLMAAIYDYIFKRSTSQDFKDAQRWFFDRVPAVTSFESVCDLLGLEPNSLRVQLAGIHTERASRPDRVAALMKMLALCGIGKR